MTPLPLPRTICTICEKTFEIHLVRNMQAKHFLVANPVRVSHCKGGNSEEVEGTFKLYEVRDGELVEVPPVVSDR
jgi:hypothetical protein